MRRTKETALALAAGAVVAIVVGVAPGCSSVTPIDVHDERVPLEARQWVGGADDAVSIAQADYDDARAEAAAVAAWAAKVERDPKKGGLAGPLAALVAAREKLAALRVEHAEVALELAGVAREKVHAETAMRYDLAVYELAPMRAEVAALERERDRLARAVEEAVVARETASAAFWSAYRTAAQAPEGVRLFWTE